MNFYLNSVAEEKNTVPTSMLSEAVVCQLSDHLVSVETGQKDQKCKASNPELGTKRTEQLSRLCHICCCFSLFYSAFYNWPK